MVLAAPVGSVVPGSSSESVVLVRNTGTEPDVFDVVVQGLAAPWASVEPAVLELEPDQEAPVWLRFHPPRSATTAPGPTPFDVAVVSRNDPTYVGIESGTVDVAAYADLSVATAGDARIERRTVLVPVTVINGGNAPAAVTVCVRGDRGEPLSIDVPAGERATLDMPTPLARRREGERVVVDVLPASATFGDPLSVETRLPAPPSTLRRDLTRSAVVLGIIVAIALIVSVTALRGREDSSGDTTASKVTLAPGEPPVVIDPDDVPDDTVAPDAATTTAAAAPAAASGPPADLPLLAFVRVYSASDRDIVVRAAGAVTQETRLRSPGSVESQPVLSPDRTRIGYVRERGGQWNACVIPTAGGETSCGPVVDSASSVGWRADGRSLVVSQGGRLHEVEYDPDATTLGSSTDLGVDVPTGGVFSLSPDGERIVFTDSRRLVVRPLAGGEGLSVRVPGSPQNVRWSQDGSRIVYVSEYQIYSAPVGDGPVRRLTGPGSVNGDPTVAGAWVVFRSNRSGQGDLYAVRSDAKEGNEAGLARVTATPERDVEPAA